MSQETLARFAQTSTKTIARIEARQVNPRARTLDNIAVALGMRADFLEVLQFARDQNRRTQIIEANRRRRRERVAVIA